jgi:hypothetical protein
VANIIDSLRGAATLQVVVERQGQYFITQFGVR